MRATAKATSRTATNRIATGLTCSGIRTNAGSQPVAPGAGGVEPPGDDVGEEREEQDVVVGGAHDVAVQQQPRRPGAAAARALEPGDELRRAPEGVVGERVVGEHGRRGGTGDRRPGQQRPPIHDQPLVTFVLTILSCQHWFWGSHSIQK